MAKKSDYKHLAIAYQAFCEACDQNNDTSRIAWGHMLLDAQALTRIQLMQLDTITMIVDGALRRRQANAY